jgi:hypothetical protein
VKLRSSLAAGLVAVAAVSLATAGLAERSAPPASSVDADLTRHARRHRPLVPRSRPTPEPTEEPDDVRRQSGSSEGTGTHIEGSVTEHHRISGSGSISVSSGAVDEGTGGREADASRVGPQIRGRRRR